MGSAPGMGLDKGLVIGQISAGQISGSQTCSGSDDSDPGFVTGLIHAGQTLGSSTFAALALAHVNGVKPVS